MIVQMQAITPAAGHTTTIAPHAELPRLADLRAFDRTRLISPAIVAGTTRLCELALTTLLGIGIAVAYLGSAEVFEDWRYMVAIALTGLVGSLAAQALGTYTVPALSVPLRTVPRLMLAWVAAFGALVAGVFLMKAGLEFSRVWLSAWLIAGLVALAGSRFLVAVVVQRWQQAGRLNRRAVIYGGGESCEALIKALEADPSCDIIIAGIFDDRGGERVSARVAGYPNMGRIEDLLAFCRTSRVDLLLVALPITAENRLLQILRQLWVLPVNIRLAAHANKLRFRPRAYSYIGNIPLIDLFDKPIADWDNVVKSLFDKTVALLALLLLSPVMLAVAAAIRLESKGPVFFRQRRYGFNNELVEVFKFRSMHAASADATAAKLVTRDDPRVTRVGRFIRKTSLDELPQLINVLKGDLSLVGPRPHALQAKAADRLYQDVVDGYFARHKVKPGMTGWAQINGWRGETDTPEKIQKRVEHDLFYIENWSLFLDVYILLRTPLALLKTEHAY